SLSSGHIPLGKTFECLWPFGPASIRMSSELRPNRLNGPPQLLTCEGVARIELERAFQGILELLLLQGELKLVAAEHPARLEVTAPLIGCATLEWRLLDQLVEPREEPALRSQGIGVLAKLVQCCSDLWNFGHGYSSSSPSKSSAAAPAIPAATA